MRTAAMDDPGARPDAALVESVAGPGYSDLRARWPKLIESMRNPTLVRDKSALTVFNIQPMGLKEAIKRALHHENLEYAATFWSDALSSSGKPASWGGVRFGTRLVDSRTVHVSVPPALAFAPIQRIGGLNGWYFASFLWQIRGFFDLLVVAWDCAGAAVILTHWWLAMLSISGASRVLNQAAG